MKAVEILKPFDGYPDGTTKKVFAAGAVLTIPDDIPADFAALLVRKSHAREIKVAAKKDSNP